jgi:hypothetical protein
VHHGHAHRDVANACTKIDQSVFCTGRIPRIHIVHTHLKFERRGDTVGSLDGVVLCILTVLVQVDESRRYDKSTGIECRVAL